MALFNQDGRIKNSAKASGVNIVNQLINVLLSFAYRTIFIKILAIEYLGLNGLFTDILNLLSLAEMGIGTSIAFRLYKPIRENDVEYVAKLMNFFKKVYWIIAIVVTSVGLAIMPIVPYVVNNSGSSLPSDVNLYLLYFLFLMQSVSGYFFAYKQTLLNADQRSYRLTIYNIVTMIVKFAGQIAILIIFKDYMFTLVFTIGWSILANLIISLLITKSYKEVFQMKVKLTKDDQKSIMKDTGALVLHKVGGVVLSSTDSIIITAMIGLAINGILSNYIMIIGVMKAIYSQIFAGVGAGFGNVCSTNDTSEIRRIFKNFNFVSLWLTGFFCIGLICLINPFIEIWLVESKFLLSYADIIFIIISLYLQLGRLAIGTIITSAGIFRKDKFRPLIEAGLNIIISVVLAKFIGLKGVYIGTIVSFALTAFWREVYIGSKFVLKEKQSKYWLVYIGFAVMSVAAGAITFFAINYLPKGIGYFILKLIMVIVIPNVIFVLCTFKFKQFKYFYAMVYGVILKIFNKLFNRKSALIGIDGEVADGTSGKTESELDEIAKSIEITSLENDDSSIDGGFNNKN